MRLILSNVLSFLAIFCAICVLLFAVSQALLAVLYRKSKKKTFVATKPIGVSSDLPSVLVQLPIYNERHVIERLLWAVAAIDYPRKLLTIQLLDDSTDDTGTIAGEVMQIIMQSGGPKIEHIRRPNRQGYKAGALANGLQHDKSELVAIFDADFLPRPNVLRDLLPYFKNPKVGLVQTRWEHINRDYSLLTRMMAFAIDNHFSVEQGGRQNLNCFVNFNGTAGMWRREAIEDAGGWSDDCLTEDLDLSFRAQLKGWEFLFVEQLSTPSELPITMQAIRDQQTRWTKGAAETGRKNLSRLWTSAESLQRKVIGSFHMFNSSVFLPLLVLGISCALLTLLPGTISEFVNLSIHLTLVTAMILTIFTYWVSRRYGDFDWLNTSTPEILSTTFLFILFITGFSLSNGWAAAQGLSGKQTAFARTPKFNIDSNGKLKASQRNPVFKNLPTQFYFECLILVLFGLSLFVSFWRGNFVFIDISAFFFASYFLTVFFTLEDRNLLKAS